MASKAVFCLVMNPHDKLVMMIWDYDGKCMEMYFSGVKVKSVNYQTSMPKNAIF